MQSVAKHNFIKAGDTLFLRDWITAREAQHVLVRINDKSRSNLQAQIYRARKKRRKLSRILTSIKERSFIESRDWKAVKREGNFVMCIFGDFLGGTFICPGTFFSE